MKVTWSPRATKTARRFVRDQDGMEAITLATARLAEDPRPPEAIPWGSTGLLRLHVGRYRVMYRIDGEVIEIGHVDRVAD